MTRPGGVEIDLSSKAPESWDAFVRETEGSSFCHLSGWGEVFRRSLALDPLFFSARTGDELVGCLPVVRMPRLGLGRVMISMPFLNYGGPLGPPEVQAALLSSALQEARDRGDRKLEVRARNPQKGPVADEVDGQTAPIPAPGTDAEAHRSPTLSPGREKVTVVLDLPEDPDTLFKDRFKAKLRSQIRRPTKEGMEARFGPEEREAFYQVFSQNMRDLGTPVLPDRFFAEIARVFADEVDFGAVYHEGQPVAGGCGFHFRGEFEMTWASSLREFNRQAPNMLLYWAFMERCIQRGHSTFNFGRCTPGGGTHRFKRQWGGDDEPLSWLQWPEEAPSEDPEEGVFGLAVRVWQKLPLPVANALGPKVARRIPTF